MLDDVEHQIEVEDEEAVDGEEEEEAMLEGKKKVIVLSNACDSRLQPTLFA